MWVWGRVFGRGSIVLFFFILVFKILFCLLNVYCSGFFNCFSKDGKVYDEIKYVWL